MVRQLNVDWLKSHPFERSRNETQLLPHAAKAICYSIGKDSEISGRPVQSHAGQHPEQSVERSRAIALDDAMPLLATRARDDIVALGCLRMQEEDVFRRVLKIAVHDHVPGS